MILSKFTLKLRMFSNGKVVPVTFNKQLKILHKHMSALLLASASLNIQCSAAYSLPQSAGVKKVSEPKFF